MRNLILVSTVKGNVRLIIDHIEGDHRTKKLLFIPTASEPEVGYKGWVDDERHAFESEGFTVTHFSLTDKTEDEVKQAVESSDIVFVGGGNPFYLLSKVQQTNFKEYIRKHVELGKLYIGASSGALVAGPDLEPAKRDDALSRAPKLQDYTGIGLVDFIVFPHWGSIISRDLYLHHRMELAYSTKYKIILLTDSQALVVKGDWYHILD